MAWVATEDFNGYSNGDLATLNGGTGWSAGWVNGAVAVMNVTGSQTYEGAKAVDVNDASSSTFYYRQLTTAVSGDGNIVYFAMRRSLNNSGELSGGLRTNAASRVAVKLDASGNLVLSGSTSTTVLAGYSTNTWYLIRLTFNVNANTATCAYATTTGTIIWSSESSAVTMNSTGDITRFQIQSDPNAGTDFFDFIQPTVTSVAINSSEIIGTSVESVLFSQVLTASETMGSPVENSNTKYGFKNETKNSTNWVNENKDE